MSETEIQVKQMTDAEEAYYLRSLKPGEQVIETGSNCMHGRYGTVYISEREGVTKGSLCVMWDGGMGTAVTHGTRRISDVPKMTEPAKTLEIKRWDVCDEFGNLSYREIPTGNWCEYADVAHLLQRIAELEAANEKLKADYQQVFADKCAVLRQAYPEHYRH